MNKKSRNDPAQAIEVAIFQAGEQIIPLGFDSPYFFVILSGQVMLTQKGKRIRTLGELDIFGLESLLLRRPSHYRAEAVQKCRIAKYSPEILDYLIRKSPRMVENVLSSMVRQLTQTVGNLLEPPPETFEAKDRVLYISDGEEIRDDMDGGSALYRLISTEDRVQVTIEGRETMRITKPGEFFGAPTPAPQRLRTQHRPKRGGKIRRRRARYHHTRLPGLSRQDHAVDDGALRGRELAGTAARGGAPLK